MEFSDVRSNMPYPSLKDIKYNPDNAKILQSDFSGINGEYTTISVYTYQHLWFSDKKQEFSETIRNIAIVEMHHLDLLGKAIIKMGGDPRYRYYNRTSAYSYWSASLVSYEKNLKNIILENIESEQKAISNYSQHIKIIKDEKVKELLTRIILDEKKHVLTFENLYKKYCI